MGMIRGKHAKLTGILRDIVNDINRRQIFSIDVFRTHKNIFNGKNSKKMKPEAFKACVASVVLYKSDTGIYPKDTPLG